MTRSVAFVSALTFALTLAAATSAQRRMVEELYAGPRAGAGGPFNVLPRSPEMGDLAPIN